MIGVFAGREVAIGWSRAIARAKKTSGEVTRTPATPNWVAAIPNVLSGMMAMPFLRLLLRAKVRPWLASGTRRLM